MSNSSCVLFNASLQLSTTTRKILITHLYHCITRPVLERTKITKDSFPCMTNNIPPPSKLYECFPSPVLFTLHLPLFNLLYISPLCYLLHIFPSAIHFIAALLAIYIKSPALQYTSHFPICYLLHFFPLYCLLNYFPLLIYLMCVLSLLFSWHFSPSVIHFKSSPLLLFYFSLSLLAISMSSFPLLLHNISSAIHMATFPTAI